MIFYLCFRYTIVLNLHMITLIIQFSETIPILIKAYCQGYLYVKVSIGLLFVLFSNYKDVPKVNFKFVCYVKCVLSTLTFSILNPEIPHPSVHMEFHCNENT
jgi:hypothetical protein